MRLVRTACRGGVAGVVVTHDAQLAVLGRSGGVPARRPNQRSDRAATRPGVPAHAGSQPVSTSVRARPVPQSSVVRRRSSAPRCDSLGLAPVPARMAPATDRDRTAGRRRGSCRGSASRSRRTGRHLRAPSSARRPPAHHLGLGLPAGSRRRGGEHAVRPDRSDRARKSDHPWLGQRDRCASAAARRALLEPDAAAGRRSLPGRRPGRRDQRRRGDLPAAHRLCLGRGWQSTARGRDRREPGNLQDQFALVAPGQLGRADQVTVLFDATGPQLRSCWPAGRRPAADPACRTTPASRPPRFSSSTRSRCCSSG